MKKRQATKKYIKKDRRQKSIRNIQKNIEKRVI